MQVKENQIEECIQMLYELVENQNYVILEIKNNFVSVSEKIQIKEVEVVDDAIICFYSQKGEYEINLKDMEIVFFDRDTYFGVEFLNKLNTKIFLKIF